MSALFLKLSWEEVLYQQPISDLKKKKKIPGVKMMASISI